METIFYCTPADLLSLFQEIERTLTEIKKESTL